MKGACQCLADRAPPGPAPRGCCSYLGRLRCHTPVTSVPRRRLGCASLGSQPLAAGVAAPSSDKVPGEGRAGLDPGSPVPTMHAQTHVQAPPVYSTYALTDAHRHTPSPRRSGNTNVNSCSHACKTEAARAHRTQRQAQATMPCTQPRVHRHTHSLTPTHA